MDIEGKVALVTGAANGIGFEIVKELLKNGAKGVLMADVNATIGKEAHEKLSEEYGRERVSFQKTDVTNDEELEDAFKKALELFGKLDIVVNNAGINNDQKYKLEIDINFTGVVRGTMLGFKYMGKNQLGKGGVILNTSSSTAMELQQCFPIYSSTKAAILNLSRAFGNPLHFDRTGVKVMALCPGETDTGILEPNNLLEGCFEELIKLIAGQGSQTPDAVARAAIYAIKNGSSASVWMIAQSNLYKLNIPALETIREIIISQI